MKQKQTKKIIKQKKSTEKYFGPENFVKEEKLIPNTNEKICKNCKYWQGLVVDCDTSSSTFGATEYTVCFSENKTCKRFPQEVKKHETDYCGEFKKK